MIRSGKQKNEEVVPIKQKQWVNVECEGAIRDS